MCLSVIVGEVAGAADVPPKPLAPGEVDATNSRVYIRVEKTGFGHVHGVVGMLRSGRVTLDADQGAGQLVFDTTSFLVDVAYARKYLAVEGEVPGETQREVTANMLSAEVLDVKQFPTATFDIASTRKTPQPSRQGLPVYEFIGEFTLHGVKRPLRFQAEVQNRGEFLRIRGQFPLRQSEYGIKPLRKALGAVGVADELAVHGDIIVANAVK
ncbi:YceI family protein [Lacipirellula parvula]|nr:YceI family protein [Lacipirellula parvula]